MNMRDTLIKEFVQSINTKPEKKVSMYYGTIVDVEYDDLDDSKIAYVHLDGSEDNLRTPIVEGTEVLEGDRVLVTIENHQAIVLANITSPASARTAKNYMDLSEEDEGLVIGMIDNEDNKFNVLIKADGVYVRDGQDVLAVYGGEGTYIYADGEPAAEFTAEGIQFFTELANYARFDPTTGEFTSQALAYLHADNLDATYASVENLEAATARIGTLEADNATINGTLTAHAASIDSLEASDATINGTLTVHAASITSLEAEDVTINNTLTAHRADIDDLEADNVTINNTLTAHAASITSLEAEDATINGTLTAHAASITSLEAEDATINNTLTAHRADIDDLEADNVTINDTLTAHAASIEDLEAEDVTINGTLTAQDARISSIESDYVNTQTLEANYAHISNGVIDNANIDYAKVNGLNTHFAHITNGVIDNAEIDYADVQNLDAHYAAIENGVISNATIDYADVNDLDANFAHITNGVIDNAKIGHADVNGLNANYAHITNGYIDNADIKEADVENLTTRYAHITNGLIDNAEIDYADVQNLSTHYAAIENGVITNAKIGYADVNGLNANYAHITSGVIDNAKIGHADVNGLNANYAHITNGYIDNADIKEADVENLTTKYAHITNGYIDNADIKEANVENLTTKYAHITNGEIDNANIGYAKVNGLSTNYAQINLANVNNAWLTNGVIKNAAITNEQVLSVSANKLTAGTIDASEINVANLRANNLIVEKLNGQPVIGGYELVSKNSTGYSGKNPSSEGWYEYQNGTFTASTDTTVNASKAYYKDGTQVALYDQTYIDGLETTLNQRIDGAVETFTGTAVPTLLTYPASDWTSSQYASHVGDIYYVVNSAAPEDGYCYRFAYDNTTSSYKWILIKDSDVTAALADISDLQTFESTTTSWINETDEGLETIRQNHTSLSGVVNKTVKESIQLWYTKANTTAPNAPTAEVTSTSTSGNAWRKVVPTYNASYPYYYYCWQYKFVDNTFGWSAVIYDRATTESEERARTGVADAATADGKAVTAQNTANANIKSSVQLWFTKANTTAPTKPTAQITNNNASGSNSYNKWNLVVPVYNSSYPYYYYCYQQQKGDDSYQWSDVVYDQATTEAMKKAQEALPASDFTTFQSTTFKDVKDTVDEHSSTFTTLTETVNSKADGSTVTTLSNTVNSVSQTATGNSTKLSQLTQTLGTNADGTTKTGDIMHRMTTTENDLDGFKTTVSNTYQTKSDMSNYSTTAQMNSAINQKANEITTSVSETYATQASVPTKVSDLTNDSNFATQSYADGKASDAQTAAINDATKKLAGQFAISTTSGNTTAKTATITPSVTGWTLYTGATITVKFTNANTATTPTLNINSTGAKTIKAYTGTAALTESEYKWPAGATMSFVYDGTYWRIQDSTELIRLSSAESSITQTANSIVSLVANTDTYTKPDGTTATNTIKSAISQNASDIALRVEKSGVIAAINASVEESGGSAVKIQASKVDIEGAVLFSTGRLSESSLNNAYDAKGAAAAVQTSVNTAVKSTVSCYYRSTSNSTPTISASTTIGTANNTDNTWTYVMPLPKRNTYFFTCEEYTLISGTKTYSTVRALNSQTYASKWVSSSDNTYIDGGRIYANSVTTAQLATDSIKSLNYQASSNANSPYSAGGSFFNLADGNIYTPNFGVQSTTGKAYLNGEIIATSGTIGDDSGNYWAIGNTEDADNNTMASIVGNGTAYIQDGDFQIHNGDTNNSRGSINTQWYATPVGGGGLQITYPKYNSTYYDYGMTSPILDTSDSRYYNETVSQNFLYIRKHDNTIPSIPSDWQYLFRVNKDGSIYANSINISTANGLIINGTSIQSMIENGVADGAYLSTSGGTVNGNVTITGSLTATASKAISDKNGSDITSTYMKLAGTNTNSATNTFSGTNTFNNTVNISKAASFIYSGIQNATENANRYVWFSNQGTNGTPVYNDNFKYNPATDILTVGSITGNAATATKATQDASGNVITSTYAKIDDASFTGATTAESINSDEIIAGSLIVNGDARFVNTINGSISGNAATATTSTSANSLSSSGTIKVNLASTTASTYTSGGNITPGVSGTLPVGNGGTGKSSWTQYGILYASASNTLAQLGVGTSGQVLTSKGSATPEWTNQSSLSVGSATKDGSGNIISSYYAPKSTAVTNVAYDSTNTKLTKTINGTTTDIVTVATLKSAMSLNNVTNNKQVKGLSSGTTSGHLVTWGSDGYTVADSGIAKGSVTTKITLSGTDYSASSNAITITKENLQDAVQDTSYVLMTSEERSKLSSIAVSSGGTIDFSGVTASAPLTATVATDKTVKITHNTSLQTAGTYRSVTVNTYGHVTAGTNPTTLSGYGITDAKIASGVITLGSNTITPLTADSTIAAGKVSGTVAAATKATQDSDGKTINTTYLKVDGSNKMTNLLTLYREGTTDNNYPAGIKFSVKDTTNSQTYSDAYIYAYQDHLATTYGTNLVIRSGGGLFLGSGESPSAHYSAKGSTYSSEEIYMTSDSGIYIQSNGNTIANRLGFYLNTSQEILPCKADTATNNVGSIGNATYKWANMYATTFNGALSGNATTATSLASSGTIQTSLSSTSAATYTSGGNITPGVKGTLGVGNGGTGQTSAKNAANSFLNELDTGSSTPVDADYYISQYVNGGTTTTTYHRRPMSALWSYIKGKLASDTSTLDGIYAKLSGATFTGAVTGTSFGSSSYIATNTGNSGTAGGLALYATNPVKYGIAMRNVSNSGAHGYVQGDWAIYNYMDGTSSNIATRGWVWKNVPSSTGVASISGAGNAVFNGSVTVGGNIGNTSGARMEFNSTNNCIDFIFN